MGLGLPDIDKTWQFYVNKTSPFSASAATNTSFIFLNMKIGLTTFTTNPWTVEYSCDGVVAGAAGDLVDRWGADLTDLTGVVIGANDSAIRSWIILKQEGLADNFQICLDLSSGNYKVDVIYSYSAGFTGGTTTARPTATDEIVLMNNVSTVDTGLTKEKNFHIMMSTDGEVTRIFMNDTSDGMGFFSFEMPKNPATGWTNQHVAITTFSNGTGDQLTYDVLAGSSRQVNEAGAWTALTNSVTGIQEKVPLYISTEGTISTYIGNHGGASNTAGMNLVSKKFELYPAGIFSSTPPFRGRHGTLYDMWYISKNLRNGTTIPATGKEFVVFGVIVVPWDGSSEPNVFE